MKKASKKDKALLCIILDRSGSMSGKEAEVIGGVNSFIDDQKQVDGDAVLSLVRFDTEYENFRPAHALDKATHIDTTDYKPRGMTALLDAVGRAMGELDEAWKKHKPGRAICVIVTDGLENSSHEFTRDKVKDMIQSREKSGKWSFIYLGADPNAFAEAGSLGIQLQSTARYTNTMAGTRAVYASLSASVAQMRSTGAMTANLGGDLDEHGALSKTPQPKVSQTSSGAWIPPA